MELKKFIEQIYANIPKECLWVFSDELVVRAIRLNMEVSGQGPRRKILHVLLRFLRWQWLQMIFILVEGVICSIGLLVKQISMPRLYNCSSKIAVDKDKINIFVGFGARAEKKIFSEFLQQYQERKIYINTSDMLTMALIQHIGAFEMLKEILLSVKKLRTAILNLPKSYNRYRLDWSVSAAMRIKQYAYAKVWFTAVKRIHSDIKVYCLAGDTYAFAAIDASIPTHFIQHGLLSKNIIFPAFESILPLTSYEAEYVSNYFDIKPFPPVLRMMPTIDIGERRTAIFVSGKLSIEMKIYALSFLKQLMSLGLAVYVRPYIGEEISFWELQQHKYNLSLFITSSKNSFSNLVDSISPLFIVSWGSTTLAESLYMGIIPICIADINVSGLEDTVFPLLKCSLHWPSDNHFIYEVCQSQLKYTSTLNDLRANALFVEI